ncbi:MAG: hypothetical protein WKF88_09260 [Ferruginibacter sp.]
MKEQFYAALRTILGDKPDGYYLAALFFSLIGILVALYQSSKKRNPRSTSTPVHFSWVFLIWDNAKRMAVTLIVMFIIFRVFDLPNPIMMIAVGIVGALYLDKAIEWLMNKAEWLCDLLSRDRNNFPQKPQSENDENNTTKPK